MTDFLEFLISHQDQIFEQTIEHIGLTVVALAIAVFIGLPLGILLTRYKKLSSSVLGVTGIIQTIPSVALLGFLLPFLGIGVTPAVIALFLYALLPIVRNTFTGIEEVDASVKEAARGMGMSDIQVLAKVELPLAVPVIFAGIRTATVINVGVATLCALIASGGLGEFIFRGIALNNMNMILAGAIPAALLALILDGLLSIVQKYIRRIIKPFLVLVCLLIFICIPIWIIPSMFQHTFQAGFTAEFMERADGYPGFKQHYQLTLDTVELDPGLMYKALKEKKVDVICGFSTDGRIKAYDFQVLRDDKHYFPPYHAAPLIRGETLRKYPILRDLFSQLAGKISDKKMAEFNYRVDHGKQDPARAAKDFLQEIKIDKDNSIKSFYRGSLAKNYKLQITKYKQIPNYNVQNYKLTSNHATMQPCNHASMQHHSNSPHSPHSPHSPKLVPLAAGGKITIGCKNFTEQFILAHIFALLIENNSSLEVELKTGLAGTKICFDALVNGEIDLYPEYTGTGLLVLLDADRETREAILRDEQKVYNYVKAETKKRYDLYWLLPLGFNNTYALMMRREQAKRLEIETISDLKKYIDQLHAKDL
jgi:osmoprotectant transport system permease protein